MSGKNKKKRSTYSIRTEEFREQLNSLKKVLNLAFYSAIVIIIVAYFSTTLRQIKVQETGVLLRLGKIVRSDINPGICMKLPYPFDRLYKVETRSVKRIRAGFGEDPKKIAEFERVYGSIDQLEYPTLRIPYVITGDKNILHVKLILTYKISDITNYLFNVEGSENIAGKIIQNSLINEIIQMGVDEVLTSGKLELRHSIQDDVTEKFKEIGLGIEIVSVEVKNVRPPRSTTAAFKDVINAQEERAELIHQAESYRNKIIPQARAEAAEILQKAKAYRSEQIAKANGETESFLLLAQEYKRQPDITRERLRVDTVKSIFPNLTKYISNVGSHDQLVNLKIFQSIGDQ